MKHALVLAAVVSFAAQAGAGTLTLTCKRADVFNPKWAGPLTFEYDNEARTLRIAGPFGDFSIPAKRDRLPVTDGVTGEAIDGVAKTSVTLPTLADLEACMAKTSGPGSAASDDQLNARDGCLRKLEPAGGVAAIAESRLGFTADTDNSGEDAFVVFRLRYDGKSQYFDGKMIVEAFPADCIMRK